MTTFAGRTHTADDKAAAPELDFEFSDRSANHFELASFRAYQRSFWINDLSHEMAQVRKTAIGSL